MARPGFNKEEKNEFFDFLAQRDVAKSLQPKDDNTECFALEGDMLHRYPPPNSNAPRQ